MSLKNSPSVGIIGAGILGSLLSLRFHKLGWKVTLFEQEAFGELKNCSQAAAGMLAPYCELDSSEKLIFELGTASLEIWPHLLREFNLPVFFQKEGSLVIAHPYDLKELERFRKKVASQVGESGFREMSSTGLSILEPGLDYRFIQGLYFPYEGQIDNRHLLREIRTTLDRLSNRKEIQLNFSTKVTLIQPHQVGYGNESVMFDTVVDCRGIDAQKEISELRAVRGEIILVESKDVKLKRPVRLMHPRHPLYIIPRPEGRFILGATSIDSNDRSPISVRSALELLSAAYTVSSAFSEARILETIVGLRPAFPDHLPKILYQPGLIRVNGLYRHGYLISPKITELVCHLVQKGKLEPCTPTLFQTLFQEIR